jgi:anti-sigma B factor antagonist
MEISQVSLCGIPLLRVAGDIDHSASPVFYEAVQTSLALDGGRLLLDLSACPYLDSGGLGVILIAHREVRGRGWLGVVGPSPNIQRLFELVGLLAEESFIVFEDEEDVAKLISAQGPDDSSSCT